tara:strand:+ start:1555 stop:1731 length:177 start_codon:yes stop_codon:yes gene_type:complete
MLIGEILDEMERLRGENEKLRRINEEMEIKYKLMENKIKKIKLLLDAQLTLVNFVPEE